MKDNPSNPSLQLLQDNLGERMSKGFSPFGKWIDGKLIAAELGMVTVELEVRQEMCNPLNKIHGGAIAGMMDEIMGIAVFSLGRDTFYYTVNLVVDYFHTANKDEIIFMEAEVIKPGKNIINVEAKLFNTDRSKLLAKGSCNLVRIIQS